VESIHNWVAMDSMVEEDFQERSYRVTVPVYGDHGGFFSITGSAPTPEPKTFRLDKLRQQLLEVATRPGLSTTVDKHLEWFMNHTAIVRDPRHSLVRTGTGLYEVRRGGKAYTSGLNAASLRGLVNSFAEIGYSSARLDFSGRRLRGLHAYAGLIDDVQESFIRLNLGKGEYRNFSLERVAWLEVIDRDSIERGMFHHGHLEVGFMRGRGGRIHIRVLTVGHGAPFTVPVPPPEYLPVEVLDEHGKGTGLSPKESATLELLTELETTTIQAIEDNELQDNRELSQLREYLGRMRKGFLPGSAR
jgi:hypothetical protein